MPWEFRFCGQCGRELSAPRLPAHPEIPAPSENPAPTQGIGNWNPPSGAPAWPDVPVQDQPVQAPLPPLQVEAPTLPDRLPDTASRSGLEEVPIGLTEQRRRVAILFVDLVGSTSLTESLDAEAAYRVVAGYLAGLTEAVTTAGGYVVKTLGDGLMALFGAPIAHGDDPERAARAAVEMQRWMADYSEGVRREIGVTIQARVGLNYGSVVTTAVAVGGRPSFDVLGDAVNVAQRMEAAADPGSVCVTEPFYRVTRHHFEYEARGSKQVKGKKEPLLIFLLVGERPDGISRTGTLPLIGRESEMAALTAAASRLQAGEGGCLALTGARGLGKSRLLEELVAELTGLGIPYLIEPLADGGRDAPLLLWRRWISQVLTIQSSMNYDEASEEIRTRFGNSPEASWAEWLAALVVEPQRLLSLEPDTRQFITRQAVRAMLSYWRSDRPAALFVDEAEHLDSLSLELLRELARDSAPPVLVGLAGRATSDFPPPEMELVSLQPIDAESARQLIERSLPAVPIPEDLCRSLVERSGGSPLFLELILAEAARAADPNTVLAAVPDTLYGLVESQLDALPAEDLRILQFASVLGANFAERWLAALSGATAGAISPWRNLEAADFLQELRPLPDRELAFRHGAIREVVYEGMLNSRRTSMHAQAAPIIAADAETAPELGARAAWHWKCAGEDHHAMRWTLRAADYAAAMYEGHEAEALYRSALEEAERLGEVETAARAALGLGNAAAHHGQFEEALLRFQAAESYLHRSLENQPAASPDADLDLLRATLAHATARVHIQMGAPAAAAPLLEQALQLLSNRSRDPGEDDRSSKEYVLCLTAHAHVLLDLGQPEPAIQAARQAMELAESQGWMLEASAAGAALGTIYENRGDRAAAEAELRRAAGRAEQASDWKAAARCWINLANVLQGAGRFQESVDAYERALDWASRIGDAEKSAIIQLNLGTLFQGRGDWTEAEEAFRGALQQFQRMGHHLGVATAVCSLSDVLRLLGRLDDAGSLLRDGEDALKRVDWPSLQAHSLVCRAELAISLGDFPAAQTLADQALTIAADAGSDREGCNSRLAMGQALLASGDPAAAARELRLARDGFARVGERLDAARATMFLAAALDRLGCPDRSAELYNEGVQTIMELGAQPWLDHLPAPAGS